MRAARVGLAVCVLVATVPLFAQARPLIPARTERLKWFHEAKYGLFIHWGLYAIPAGEWKGQRIPGIGEWIMNRAQIPVREYERLAAGFIAVRSSTPTTGCSSRIDAGMKYIVITAKHHDGFALFDSKVSAYDVMDATPFKRDILKELADACAKRGMRLGFYYSQSQDWHDPNGAGNTWDFGPDEKKDYDKYLREKAEPQVRELLTGYGPVALVWFDTPRMMTPTRAQRFVDIVRTAAARHADRRPARHGGRLRDAPATTSSRRKCSTRPGRRRRRSITPGATSTTTSTGSRPARSCSSWSTSSARAATTCSTSARRADGVIPQASQDVLRAAGQWLKVNGDAVYGAGPTPFGDELGGAIGSRREERPRGAAVSARSTEWRVTTKPGKLYFTFFDEPRAPFELPAMKNSGQARVSAAERRAGERHDRGREALPQYFERPMLDPMATVVVVENRRRPSREVASTSDAGEESKHERVDYVLAAPAVLAAAVRPPRSAQTVTGQIRGTVRDGSGGVLPGRDRHRRSILGTGN